MAAQKPKIAAVDEAATMDNTLNNGDFHASGNSPEKLEWLRDAGLGLFLHWSLDVQLGAVISHSLVGASEDYIRRYYEELPKTLNPRFWDFDRLAELARLAGFQYAVFTTKHHNGFCLWDTRSTGCSIMNTPYGRDLVAQYVSAFRRQGIKVGFYFSPEDFNFLWKRGLTVTRTPSEDYAPQILSDYRELLTRQMTELLGNYGPIDLLFFDGGDHGRMADASGENLQKLCMRLAWELQPGILITRGAIPTPEQQLPGVGADFAWEGCMTLGTAWQYQPTNEQYKTGLHVIRLLTETRAKGGSLLLNIGVDANGLLCREQEGILRELALWHFINREAVHGVRPWILTNEDSVWLLKSKAGDAVYAVLFGQEDWERGVRREVLLRSVRATEKTRIEVLGQSGELVEYRPDLDAYTYWKQEEDGLHISVMRAQRVYCGVQWHNPPVLKITEPETAFCPMRVLTADGLLFQDGKGAHLFAEVLSLGSFSEAQLAFEYREYPGFALSSYETGWQRLPAQRITAPGKYFYLLGGLKRGVIYQYRAVLYNSRNTMCGEMSLLTRE